jgi:Tropinone reductase 1
MKKMGNSANDINSENPKKRGPGRPPKKKNTKVVVAVEKKKKKKKKKIIATSSLKTTSSTIVKKRGPGRPSKSATKMTTSTSGAPVVVRKEFELITTAEKKKKSDNDGSPPILSSSSAFAAAAARNATIEGGRGRGRGGGRGNAGRGGGRGRGRGRPPALPKDGVLKRLVLQSKGVEKQKKKKKRGPGRPPKTPKTTTKVIAAAKKKTPAKVRVKKAAVTRRKRDNFQKLTVSSSSVVGVIKRGADGKLETVIDGRMRFCPLDTCELKLSTSTELIKHLENAHGVRAKSLQDFKRELELSTQKRGPGRPPKKEPSTATLAVLPKKSPGRPRKIAESTVPPQQQNQQHQSLSVPQSPLLKSSSMVINENVSRAMTLTMGLPYAEKNIPKEGAFKSVRRTPPPPNLSEVIDTPSKRGRGRPPKAKRKSIQTTTTTNAMLQKPTPEIGLPPLPPVATTTAAAAAGAAAAHATTVTTTTTNTTTTATQSRWRLDYHRIVVTGGTRGIGRACAEEFLGLGAKVFVCGRTQKSVNVAVSEMRKKFGTNKVSGIDADITTKEGRSKVLLTCDEFFGANSFDVLVNNAGWNNRQAITAQTAEDFQQIMDINFAAPYFMCVASAERLYRSSKNPSVINVSSVAGLVSTGSGVAYAASKAALVQLTKALACEWAPQVRSNCVAPWVTKTEMLAKAVKANANSLRKAEKSTPLGRAAEVTDVAAAVAFLAMPCSRYINGQIIAVDGGLLSEAHQGDCARVGPLAR